MGGLRAQLLAGSHVVRTPSGLIETAVRGEGNPVSQRRLGMLNDLVPRANDCPLAWIATHDTYHAAQIRNMGVKGL